MATGGNVSTILTLDASKFSTALDKAAGDLTKFDDRLKAATKIATEFEKSVGGLGGNITGASDKFKMLDQAVSSFSAKLASAADRFEKAASGTRSVKKAADELNSGLTPVQRSLTTITTATNSMRVAMESLKPSLTQATQGQNALAAAQDKTAASAKRSAAEGIKAQIAALEAQKSTNSQIIAQKEKLATELNKIEQQIRSQALGHSVAADNEKRLKRKGSGPFIADEVGQATRLTANADFVKGQASSAIASGRALQAKNEELARSITLMGQQAVAAEDSEQKQRAAILQTMRDQKVASDAKIAAEKEAAKQAKIAAKEATDAKKEAAKIERDTNAWLKEEGRAIAKQKSEEIAQQRAQAKVAAQEEMEQARQVSAMWKSMGQMWGASKIDKGLHASVDQADKMERQVSSMKSVGFDDEHNQRILDSAAQNSKDLGFMSTRDALKSHMSAIASVGSDNETIGQTLPTAVRAANNLNVMGLSGHEGGDLQTQIRNLYGIVEMRMQTADPEATKRTFELQNQVSVGTQGKVTATDMETVLRRLGVGANQLNDAGYLKLAALVDQFKVAGGDAGGGGASGVSTVGTMIKMFQAYAQGKGLSNEGVKEFAGAGILNEQGIDFSKDDAGVLKDAKHGGFKNAQLWMQNPVAAMQTIMPSIIEYTQRPENRKKFYEGRDPNDSQAQMTAVSEYFSRMGITTTAIAGAMSMGDPRNAKRMDEQVGTMQNVKPIDQVDAELKKTYSRNVQEVSTQLDNLATLVGTQLLPPLKTVLSTFSSILEVANNFAKNNPLITQFVGIAAAVVGVNLAIRAFTGFFGFFGSSRVMIQALTAAHSQLGIAAKGTAASLEVEAAATLSTTKATALATTLLKGEALATVTAKEATLAASIAQGAMAATSRVLGVALAAVGGPLGLIALALGVGMSLWSSWANAAEEAGQKAQEAGDRAKRAMDGLSDAKDLADNKAASAENADALSSAQLKVTGLSAQMRDRTNAGYGSDPRQATQLAAFQAELDKRKQIASDLANEQVLIKKGIEKRAEENAAIVKSNNERAAAIKAGADKGKGDYDPVAAAKAVGEQSAAVIAAEQKRIQDAANTSNVKNPHQFEDMFQRILSQAQGAANISQLKLDGGNDPTFHEQSIAKLSEHWGAGDMDKGHDPRFRPFIDPSIGGSYNDKTGWSNFAKYKDSGWPSSAMDITSQSPFINGKKGDTNVGKANELINAYDSTAQNTETEKANQFSAERLATSNERANAAASLLAKDGLPKQTAAMKALVAEYARYEQVNPVANQQKGDTSSTYGANKQSSLDQQSRADTGAVAEQLLSQADKINKKLKDDQDGMLLSKRDLIAKEFALVEKNERDKFQLEFDFLQKRIDAEEAAGQKGTEAYAKDIALRKQLTEAFSTFLAANDRALVEAQRSPVDKLVAGWKNMTDQMEAIQAKWANTFMTDILSIANGGVRTMTQLVQGVRGLASSMMKDVGTMLIKDGMSDMVGSAAKGISGMVSNLFGISSSTATKADGSAQNPFFVQLASATGLGLVGGKNPEADPTKTLFDSLKDKMTAAWDGIKSMFQSIGNSISSLFSSLFSSTGGSSGGSAGGIMGALGSIFGGGPAAGMPGSTSWGYASPMLNGGIMSALGPLSLKKYANGGVASSPQLALFGEGSMNEAYVPLPDGRSIPVSMTNASRNNSSQTQGGETVNISITVNQAANGSSTDTTSTAGSSTNSSANWSNLANGIKVLVRQELISQSRPGGMLAASK